MLKLALCHFCESLSCNLLWIAQGFFFLASIFKILIYLCRNFTLKFFWDHLDLVLSVLLVIRILILGGLQRLLEFFTEWCAWLRIRFFWGVIFGCRCSGYFYWLEFCYHRIQSCNDRWQLIDVARSIIIIVIFRTYEQYTGFPELVRIKKTFSYAKNESISTGSIISSSIALTEL